MLVRSSNLGKLLCVLALVACTKKEETYSKENMLSMGPDAPGEKVEIVLARNINDAIPCSNYGEGCLSVHRLRARNLDFIAVEFGSSSESQAAAHRIHGWTVKNWLFDDIEGEPQLERWLEKYYPEAMRFKARQTDGESPKTPAGSAPASAPTSP